MDKMKTEWQNHSNRIGFQLNAILQEIEVLKQIINSSGSEFNKFLDGASDQHVCDDIETQKQNIVQIQAAREKWDQEMRRLFPVYNDFSAALSMKKVIESKPFELALLFETLGTKNTSLLTSKIIPDRRDAFSYIRDFHRKKYELKKIFSDTKVFNDFFSPSIMTNISNNNPLELKSFLRQSQIIEPYVMNGSTSSREHETLARFKKLREIYISYGLPISYTFVDGVLAAADKGMFSDGDYCIVVRKGVRFKAGDRVYKTKDVSITDSNGRIMQPSYYCLPLSILPYHFNIENHMDGENVTNIIEARVAPLNLFSK